MTDAGILGQLSQMREEARRIGSRVAEDAISHAISCAVKGKTRDLAALDRTGDSPRCGGSRRRIDDLRLGEVERAQTRAGL
jgi:hypothetical protein